MPFSRTIDAVTHKRSHTSIRQMSVATYAITNNNSQHH
jgi:hypothetical protein